jgi:16S rRNA (cytosine967-C5)-methyltransferase
MRFNNSPAPLMLRANTLKTTRDALAVALSAHAVETEAARFAPDALVVRSGNPLLTPLDAQGLFVVQDEASQLVALFAGAQPGERILDACASPGGKTIAMAARLDKRGSIVACDVRGRRVALLARTVQRSGARGVQLVQADVTRPLPFGPVFDRVLLDAPCSGLGTIRRDPDIRWRRTAEDLPILAAEQRHMLSNCAAVLRPGGALVYATCSSEPEENDEVVDAFCIEHPEFVVARVEPHPALARFVGTDGRFRTQPARDGLEAFFAAILVR